MFTFFWAVCIFIRAHYEKSLLLLIVPLIPLRSPPCFSLYGTIRPVRASYSRGEHSLYSCGVQYFTGQ